MKEKDIYSVTQHSYNQIADSFSSRHPTCRTFKHLLMMFASLLPVRGLILDAGCGNGKDSSEFIKLGFRVVGIDYAIKMLKGSQQTFITSVQMDMRALGFAACSFDAIWANSSLHHVGRDDVLGVCKEFSRVIKSRGKLFISCRDDLTNGWDDEYENYPRYYNGLRGEEIASFLRGCHFLLNGLEYLTSNFSNKRWFCIWATKEDLSYGEGEKNSFQS